MEMVPKHVVLHHHRLFDCSKEVSNLVLVFTQYISDTYNYCELKIKKFIASDKRVIISRSLEIYKKNI